MSSLTARIGSMLAPLAELVFVFVVVIVVVVFVVVVVVVVFVVLVVFSRIRFFPCSQAWACLH